MDFVAYLNVVKSLIDRARPQSASPPPPPPSSSPPPLPTLLKIKLSDLQVSIPTLREAPASIFLRLERLLFTNAPLPAPHEEVEEGNDDEDEDSEEENERKKKQAIVKKPHDPAGSLLSSSPSSSPSPLIPIVLFSHPLCLPLLYTPARLLMISFPLLSLLLLLLLTSLLLLSHHLLQSPSSALSCAVLRSPPGAIPARSPSPSFSPRLISLFPS